MIKWWHIFYIYVHCKYPPTRHDLKLHQTGRVEKEFTLLPSTGCSVNFISLLNHIPSLFANSNK